MTRLLAVRLDSDGDVLLTGPALRALATTAQVDLLASPAGSAAGRLLPGVDEVLELDAPWCGYSPPPVEPATLLAAADLIRSRGYDRAVVFTSFHQSPLPTALLLRLAGVPWIGATSVDYPGSLLDLRHQRPEGLHEVEAALDLAVAAGGRLAPGDDDRLSLRGPLPDPRGVLRHDLAGGYVVVHPGASVPSRAPSPDAARDIVTALCSAGYRVVVTGGPGEGALARHVSSGAPEALDAAGRTSLRELAGILAGAAAVVVGNTGPAHLAAAVGTPVVSLFAPVVPVDRWGPWRVPSVVLGDQAAACAGSRARTCPVPGHPCLSDVSPAQVVAAVDALTVPASATADTPAGLAAVGRVSA
jgi:heptosyltransferase III